jgi:hypothetical protein
MNNRCLAQLVLVLPVLAVALGSPGQWSFDTVVALGEAQSGVAVGWGSPFFAALLSWLGGGEVAAALFVAGVTMTWVFALVAALQPSIQRCSPGPWRTAAMALLVLNPMIWLYLGIVWKDVLLGILAVASVACLDRAVALRSLAWGGAGLAVLGVLPLVRQQGVLVTSAIGLVFAIAWLWRANWTGRALGLAGALCAVVVANLAVSSLADRTVRPPASSPFSVGLLTVMSYDVLGTIAHTTGEVRWADAEPAVVSAIREDYSPERIDDSWRRLAVASWIQQRSAESVRQLWWAALKEDPMAYLRHRMAVAGHLFGFFSMRGCVYSYWGVAGPPDTLAMLGVEEAMDPRDRLLGRFAEWLSGTPLLRHWLYGALLALASVVIVLRRCRGDAAPVAAVSAAWIYGLSFVPTSIACDFRYLFPAAALTVFACVWLLARPAVAQPERCGA